MSISIGGINLGETVINTEFRINVLERVVDKLISHAPSGALTTECMEQIRKDALKALQEKYPNAGIGRKKSNQTE